MIRSVGIVAVAAVSGSRRWMDGTTSRLLRHVVAIEADRRTVSRCGGTPIFMTGRTIQFRVNRCFQQTGGSSGMGRMAGRAVDSFHRDAAMGLPEPACVSSMAAAAELVLSAY